MALRSITIENFKCIGDAVTIPIRPITLLFGKNSSGKSTVLQALSYMLHVIKGGDPDPHHLMGMDTDFMDMGSFRSFVHLFELDRKIVIRIEFEVEREGQLGWAEIKTGWNIERGSADILSRKIGIGDDEWEYDNVSEEMEHLKTSFIEELEGIRLLAPIREVLPRDMTKISHVLELFDDQFKSKMRNEPFWNGLQAWEILLRDCILEGGQLIKKINDQMEYLKLGYKIDGGEGYATTIDTDDLKKKLRELYDSAPKNGDSQDQVSEILKQLPRPQRTFQFQLFDKKDQKYLHPLDVGSGVSQIIPVLVGVLEDSYRLFAVAQPELHVHPAIQVGLGDVFIDAIKNSDRTMLIETHSEHLLLRLLRRVRETNIRKSKKYEWQQSEMIPLHREMSKAIISDAESQDSKDHSLTPDKLSIVYVESTSEGVEFIPLNVMDDGDFDGPWPEGFFDERVEELL